VGTMLGTWMASTTSFKAAVFTLSFLGVSFPGYIALWALVANIVISIALSLVLKPFVTPAPVLAE
jgi:solute:Na+ symporter, SSS family